MHVRVISTLALLSVTPAAALAQGPSTTDGYVPDSDCAVCHRAVYDSYRHVGMARSFSRPRTESIIEDFGDGNHYYHAPSRRHYEMLHRDGRFEMRRYQLDEAGEPYNELVQPIDWIIGSGDHSRGYLYQTEAGELFELPVAWYTQAGAWRMAPGYDRPDHDGVHRQITRDCMFCHNAYPRAPAGSDRYGAAQVFPRDLPEGTGCQRCHGPGAEHVRLANDLDAPLDDVIAAIVNPGRLPPEQRDDACYQCHLQPTSKLTSFVRRFGRPTYSYRPDEPIHNYLVHLDSDGGRPPDPPEERFEINHHPYRLRHSTCWIESEGALGCLTCHDPHRVVAPEHRAAHFRDACLTCHQVDDCNVDMGVHGGADAGDCVSCHMPVRRTQDVIHVTMTDHRIQRFAPSPGEALAPLAETPPPRGARVTPYLDDRIPRDPVAAMYVAIAAANDGNLGALDALEQLVSVQRPGAVEPLKELAAGQLKAGRVAAAAATLVAVVQRAPEMGAAWADLGTARAMLGDTESAVVALERAVKEEPVLPEAYYNLGACYARLGRTDDAIEAYRRCVELRPNHAKAWLNLGNLLARGGALDASLEAFTRAGAAEPALTAAAVSLAAANRHLDRWPEAARALERGRLEDPADVRLAVELARLRLFGPPAVRDPRAAIEPARAAARHLPDVPELPLMLAWAALLAGEPDAAHAAATSAMQAGGARASTEAMMALALHAQGRDDEARRRYRAATALWRAQAPGDDLGRAIKERADATFGS